MYGQQQQSLLVPCKLAHARDETHKKINKLHGQWSQIIKKQAHFVATKRKEYLWNQCSNLRIVIVRGIDCVWIVGCCIAVCLSTGIYRVQESWGASTSGYIWQPIIHNIYPTKYIPTYMVVYYTEYIAYQIYSNIPPQSQREHHRRWDWRISRR
jgi:hypothetical protein